MIARALHFYKLQHTFIDQAVEIQKSPHSIGDRHMRIASNRAILNAQSNSLGTQFTIRGIFSQSAQQQFQHTPSQAAIGLPRRIIEVFIPWQMIEGSIRESKAYTPKHALHQ